MILLAHAASLIWTSDLFLLMVLVAFCCSTTFYRLDTPQWMYVVFLGWCIIGIALNPYPVLAIHGWMMRCEGYLTYLILARAAWIYWTNYNNLTPLLYTSIGLCAFLLFLDMIGRNHIPIMAVAGWVAPVTVLIWVYEKGWLVLSLPIVLMCQNRSCVIGIIVGIITAELMLKHWKRCLIGLAIVSVLALSYPPLRTKFNNFNFDSTGMGSRSQWLMQAVELSRKNPVFGTGLGTLSCHLRPATGVTAQGNTWPDKTHNIEWDYIATTGWTGFMMLLLMVGCALGIAIKYWNAFRIAGLSTDIAACVSVLACYIALGFFNPQGIPAHFIALTCLFGINRHRLDV